LSSDDVGVRYGAARELVYWVDQQRVRDALIHVLQTDPSPFVRCGAVEGLANEKFVRYSPEAEATGRIREALRNAAMLDSNPVVRRAAERELFFLGDLGPGREPIDLDRAHLLTWTNYTGIEPMRQAIYLLDGEECGQGEAGFSNVLQKLAAMPSGATLVIYPDYSGQLTTGHPPRRWPYVPYRARLDELARRKEMVIVHRPAKP
jgi:hypothetical protein